MTCMKWPQLITHGGFNLPFIYIPVICFVHSLKYDMKSLLAPFTGLAENNKAIQLNKESKHHTEALQC